MDQLGPEEIQFLNTNGYLALGQLLSESALSMVNGKLSSLLQKEGEQAGSELFDSPYIKHPKEIGADRLADLVNKGEEFDSFYTHPKLLAAIRQVLGEQFKLSSLNYRSAKPGLGLQKLHVDWHEPVEPGDYKVCNSIWLLDDFSEENGGTRIVPGTHLNGKLPEEEMEDPMLPHPEQLIIEAPAGSVFLFNSHVWHGGTTNRTNLPRRAIHAYFCRRDQPQQLNQKDFITDETRQRITDEAIHILDV